MNLRWGIYPWFIELGTDLIHPSDLDAFKEESNNSKIFECVDVKDYITIRYNNNYYRVKERLFKLVPTPKYSFGQMVFIKEKKEIGIVTDIMWHYGKKVHYYLLSTEGKKKTRRYFEEELDCKLH